MRRRARGARPTGGRAALVATWRGRAALLRGRRRRKYFLREVRFSKLTKLSGAKSAENKKEKEKLLKSSKKQERELALIMIRTNVVTLTVIPAIAYREKLQDGGSAIVVYRKGETQPGIAGI